MSLEDLGSDGDPPILRQRVLSSRCQEEGLMRHSSSPTNPPSLSVFSRVKSFLTGRSQYEALPSSDISTPPPRSMMRDLRGDFANLFVLLLLYTLQGIPMGISMTIPLVMQERHAGYAAQAVFSVVTLPFSFKLLWAPLVDSFYSKTIGRRKSWMLPTQLLCGLCLLFVGPSVDSWIGHVVTTTGGDDVVSVDMAAVPSTPLISEKPPSAPSATDATVPATTAPSTATATDGEVVSASSPSFSAEEEVDLTDVLPYEDTTAPPSVPAATTHAAPLHQNVGLNVTALSLFFLFLYFLMATQDIAVDAWALTMLRRRNVGWASTANNVGQYLGIYLAHVGYLVFSSADTCNRYFRSAAAASDTGILTLPLFMQLCGVLFLGTTVLVGVFKREEAAHPVDQLADAVARLQAADDAVDVAAIADSTEGADGMEMDVRGSRKDASERAQLAHARAVLRRERRHLWIVQDEAPETEQREEEEEAHSLKDTFRRMWSVLRLPAVLWLVIFLVTHRLGTAPADHLTQLKLFDRGLTKADVALIVSLVSPLTVITPMLCSSVSTGPNAFAASYLSIPVRVCVGFLWALVVLVYPLYKHSSAFYCLLVCMMALQTVLSVFQSVVGMSFFAKIADPRIGGTFITLLNTAANLGGSSSRMFVMYVVEWFTSSRCLVSPATFPSAITTLTAAPATSKLGHDAFSTAGLSLAQKLGLTGARVLSTVFGPVLPESWVSPGRVTDSGMFEKLMPVGLYTCDSNEVAADMCSAVSGDCVTYVDGYFVEIVLFGVIGLIWLMIMWGKMSKLDSLPMSAWRADLKQ